MTSRSETVTIASIHLFQSVVMERIGKGWSMDLAVKDALVAVTSLHALIDS
jgi:hypothetical protein